MRFPSSIWFRIFSSLLVNLASGWFGLILFTPAFFSNALWPIALTGNLFYGTVLLIIAEKFERFSMYDR